MARDRSFRLVSDACPEKRGLHDMGMQPQTAGMRHLPASRTCMGVLPNLFLKRKEK